LENLRESERNPEVREVELSESERRDDASFGTEVSWLWSSKDDFPPGNIKWFVNLVYEEIEAAFPAVAEIRQYLREIAAALAAHGHVLEWTSPSGVPIKNEYFVPQKAEKIRLYLGAKPFRPLVHPGYTKDLDARQCERSAAPHVIHSFEASHMALVALACDGARIPLYAVHDCFFVLGCHVDELREIWLRELREMYWNENLLRDIYKYARSVLGPKAPLPGIPQHRGLDLSSVTGPYALG
jgi:hypothetical protein